VILHVRDASHAETEAQAADVLLVLDQLGMGDAQRSHLIEVWNKADLLEPLDKASLEAAASRRKDCVLISSIDGSGIDRLLRMVENQLSGDSERFEVTLPAEDGKGLAWFHERAEVMDRRDMKDGRVKLIVRMDEDRAGQAQNVYGKAMKRMKAAAPRQR
jgi:GTPase